MAKIKFKNVNKIYENNFHAVKDFNLEIDDEEFIVLVGPSGCGKSTTLRMLAGLESITSGEIYIDGEKINEVDPNKRNVAMVFQNYALYPHMTVFENMAFSLEMKKIDKNEIEKRVNETARLLGIDQQLNKIPKQLSGGQRQRVALGRAIVRNAKAFLMDEPLSNLDAKLRVQMRAELSNLHKKLGTTTLYVTHDQVEAMTMASRIVVMDEGIIKQVGTPEEIYLYPEDIFVASFLGTPQMNFYNVKFKNNKLVFSNDEELILTEKDINILNKTNVSNIVLGIRAEDIYISKNESNSHLESVFKYYTDSKEVLGDEVILYGRVSDSLTAVKTTLTTSAESGDVFEAMFDANKIHLFDKNTQKRIN